MGSRATASISICHVRLARHATPGRVAEAGLHPCRRHQGRPAGEGSPKYAGRALAELGRTSKMLHMLGYIDSKEKRRLILTQLNRQEFRHRLTWRASVIASAARSEKPTVMNTRNSSAPLD